MIQLCGIKHSGVSHLSIITPPMCHTLRPRLQDWITLRKLDFTHFFCSKERHKKDWTVRQSLSHSETRSAVCPRRFYVHVCTVSHGSYSAGVGYRKALKYSRCFSGCAVVTLQVIWPRHPPHTHTHTLVRCFWMLLPFVVKLLTFVLMQSLISILWVAFWNTKINTQIIQSWHENHILLHF